ncbi:MAG: cyclodeaminase/cyclohydrolase family protein, partial [Muribaculaceae bacterium]|nr:cyclodeaminase/cyclohydrolase family protein [Muribaculaceae bacterium]
SAHKAGWDDRWEEFADVAEKGHAIQDRLIALVDEDTEAFNRIMAVFGMPKKTPEEKEKRAEALEAATLYATEVPLRTMQTALETFDILKEMASKGNPASVSDAGVGALAARSAVLGAHLNVRINAAGLKDRNRAEEILKEASRIAAEAVAREKEILEIVDKIIDKN